MKMGLINKILLVLLLCQLKLFSQFALSDLFEMKRVSADFYGSATNGSSILVYGDGGIILRSTDIGNTWEQINLNDSLDIRQIFSINHSYYGNGSIGIIKSLDNGKTWNLYRLGDKIIKIFNYKEKLLCIARDKVIFLDTNLISIRKIQINLDFSYRNPSKVRFWYYCTELFDNRLVFYSKKGKIGFLNVETGEFSETVLKNYQSKIDLLIQSDVIKKGVEELVFVYEHDVLSFNIFRDSVDSLYRIPDTVNPHKFTLLPTNDTLYAIFSFTNKTINWDSITYSPYLDSVYFGYIEPLSKKFLNVKAIENDRSINDLYFNNLSFHRINGSLVFVAVGPGKLIYMSYDRGKHWQLKCLLNLPFLISNDAVSANFEAPIFIFGKSKARIITETGKFYATNDGGTIWLPQKNYLPKKTYYGFRFGAFLDTLKGFFYSDDPGRISQDGKIITPPSVFFTFDGGETVKYGDLNITNRFNGVFSGRISIFTPFNQYVLAGSPAYFYFIDDSLRIKKSISHHRKGEPMFNDSVIIYIDSLDFKGFFEYDDTLWALSPELLDYYLPYSYYRINIYTSNDTGNTWEKSFSFEIPNWPTTLLGQFSQSKDSLFLLFGQYSRFPATNSQGVMAMLDLKNKNSKVFVRSFVGNMMLKLCDGYYLFYFKTEGLNTKQGVLFFENWDAEELNYKEFEIFRFIINSNNINPYSQTINCDLLDSIFVLEVFDNLFNKKALYFAKIRPCVEINIPKTNSKDFYVSRPYPNPARNLTKFRIYFNPTESIETLSIDAYDYLGRKVAGPSDFKITPLNSFSFEAEWSIVGLSSGVYIIVATLNGKVSSNAVVVY